MNDRQLTSRSVNAVLWGVAGSGARIVIQFVSQVILARLLGPEQYGLYALGAMVIGFGLFFTDTGLSYSLIQKEAITDEEQRFVFTWQVLAGGLVTAVVWLASDWMAGFFRNPASADVIRGLAWICLLQACSVVSTNLLRRRLEMRAIQLAQAGSYFIGYVLVGIPLALAGFQVWSLVIAWGTQAVANLLFLYLHSRHPLLPLARFKGALQLFSYGGLVFVTNLTNWLLGNIDRFVVGRFFSTAAVGLYTTSYNLVFYGTTALHTVLQGVFFSAGSRMQQDKARLAKAASALLEGIAILVFPLFACCAAVSERLFVTLFGDEWMAASATLTPLALAMPFLLFLGVATPVLWNSGRASQEWRLQAPLLLLWAVACWAASKWSVVAVAWTVLVLFVLRGSLFFLLISRAVDLDVASSLRRCLPGLLVGTLVALSALITDRGLAGNLPQWLVLGVDGMVAALVWLALIGLFPGMLSIELAGLLHTAIHQLSPAVGRRLAHIWNAPRRRW